MISFVWSDSSALFWMPKIPWVLILTLPPRPEKALAVISLFSFGTATIVLASIIILPPLPAPWLSPAVAEIFPPRRSKRLSAFRLMSPPSTALDWAITAPRSWMLMRGEFTVMFPAAPLPWLRTDFSGDVEKRSWLA